MTRIAIGALRSLLEAGRGNCDGDDDSYHWPVLEFTDWAREIIVKANAAATRLNPDAKIRLARAGSGLQPFLVEGPEPGDEAVSIRDVTLYAEAGLDGLVDIEEPHDRIVLKPRGSSHNERVPS